MKKTIVGKGREKTEIDREENEDGGEKRVEMAGRR